MLLFSEAVRADAPAAVSRVRSLGIDVAVVTGDGEGAARAVSATLGGVPYHAGLLPEDKLEIVQGAGRRPAGLVGDECDPAVVGRDGGKCLHVPRRDEGLDHFAVWGKYLRPTSFGDVAFTTAVEVERDGRRYPIFLVTARRRRFADAGEDAGRASTDSP